MSPGAGHSPAKPEVAAAAGSSSPNGFGTIARMPILNPTRPAHSRPLQRSIAAAIATASLVMLGGCPQKEEAPATTADAQPDEAAVAVATAEAVAPAAPPASPAPPVPRPTASATLKRAELMALVFPDSQGPGASPRQPDTVSLPERANEGKTVPGSEADHSTSFLARTIRCPEERENLPRHNSDER